MSRLESAIDIRDNPGNYTFQGGDLEAVLVSLASGIIELEAENKTLRAELETAREALDGAHRVVRQIRDQQSTFPGLEERHHGQVAG